MNIRAVTNTDAETIARLHADSWRNAYRGILRDEVLDGDIVEDKRKIWQQRLQQPDINQIVVVAEQEKKLCGFVCAFGNHHPKWGTFVDNLHVSQQMKRKGIGKQLMNYVALWSKNIYPGIGLYLHIFKGNEPAQKFYEGIGETYQESKTSTPPGGGEVTNLVYAWQEGTLLISKIMNNRAFQMADSKEL